MGHLHSGHIALIEASRNKSDVTVASIFVNPMQFGASEDLEAYPRTLAEDLAKLEQAGVAAVFTPSASDIYPDGIDQHTAVDVPGLTDVLCGASRPEHFRGVTTVVTKLLGLVRPHLAFFGAKDLQQVLVIQKMVRDLCINTEIITVPTMREADGLAMSSRNTCLSDEERAAAPTFSVMLEACGTALSAPSADFDRILKDARKGLINAGFSVDYLEARHTHDLSPASSNSGKVALFGAVRLGATRLIDNRMLPAQQ